jgi:hypothetical protein
MANVIINDNHLSNIADAIRDKNGSNTTYLPSEMADAIMAISTSSGSGGASILVNGSVGSTDSNGYNNEMSFSYSTKNINLKDKSKNWKMVFYVEYRGG